MGQVAGFVGIRVEVVAGELVTITAKLKPLFPGAFIGRTTMGFTESMHLQRYFPGVVATPAANHFFYRYGVFRSQHFYLVHSFSILEGQVKMTIEAVQTAGSGHLQIIHE